MKSEKRPNMEQRLKNISELYLKLLDVVNQLPDSVPGKVKEIITEKIIGDKELKDLMESIRTTRPPKFLIVGRTGVGKSSLINAICGSYLAETNAVEVCTLGVQSYDCIRDGKVQLQILDTRGIGESFESIKGTNTTAEKELEEEIKKFMPDAILFVLPCASRDHLNSDIDVLNNIYKKVLQATPIIVVLNRADQMEPNQSNMTSERKLKNIDNAKFQVRKLLKEKKVSYRDIVAVSSYIDWGYSVELINKMTTEQRENLKIDYDGRYNINVLNEVIEKVLKDEAKTGFLLAAKMDYVLRGLGNKFVNIFSGIAAGVAVTPIPVSDVYILTSLQIIMIIFIATLSGRKADFKTAKEFMFSAGGVGTSGIVFRTFAQQSSKLLNTIIPGLGSSASSAIAFGGTKVIGQAAIDYFVLEKDLSEVKKKLRKNKYENGEASKQCH